MRWFWTLLILAGLGYAGYHYWGKPDRVAKGEPESTQGESSITAPSAELEEPPLPPPSEESKLRRQLEGTRSPEGDRLRYQLAQILLEKGSGENKAEARRLLAEIVGGKGELAPQAASRLFRESDARDEKLELARIVKAMGPGAPDFAECSLALGMAGLSRTEDSARVAAWEDLSNAYFSNQDPAWRNGIRPKLQDLVAYLIFSPRMTAACSEYTVQSGDHLATIAKAHQTTVDLVKWLNELDSDLIHPGQRLKIMTGTVTLEIDKSDYRLDARLDGRYLYSASVGLGKFGKTPVGEFVIEKKQEQPAWQKIGQPVIPYGDPQNPLGERWMSFKNTVDFQGYGIHGTDDPESIGRESSEGCIRMKNEDAILLYRLCAPGTVVALRE